MATRVTVQDGLQQLNSWELLAAETLLRTNPKLEIKQTKPNTERIFRGEAMTEVVNAW